MLEELSVKNYALIDNVTLSFQSGFNVLTGETGAGKSIIIGALGFLLGAKADVDAIRTGANEASVSAIVSLGKTSKEAFEWLAARDIVPEDSGVIVRRNIKTSGRGTAYIQNTPVTRSDLSDFMALLFDLHGQHSRDLIQKESHRRYLDHFAGLKASVMDFNRLFSNLSDKKNALAAQANAAQDRKTRLEMLRYAVDEISKAAPRVGEIQELENEAARLSDFEQLVEQVNGISETFFDGETSVLSMARHVRSVLENAAAIDASLSPLLKRMEDLYYEAEDLAGNCRAYRDKLKYEPGRLSEVEERLAALYQLKKKYAKNSTATDSEAALLAYQTQAEAEIETLAGVEESREKLMAEISALEKETAASAQVLSEKRRVAAGQLADHIAGILIHLGMPNVRFSVSVSAKGGERLICGPWGADDVEFLIAANAGEPLKDLSRIASGGELSRVMLAIKTVFSDADTIETLVFDEIDAGVGGEVALAVGEYMAKIGTRKQIFCVTHLASIAVRADNHLRVEKRSDAGRTVTGVSVLAADERRKEIARMLAGTAGSAALAHADEMLAKYKNCTRGRYG